MSHVTRRNFLKTATVAGIGASFTIAGTKASGRVLGANDTIRVCVAGINGRGQDHINGFSQIDKVQVTHLVDPDSSIHAARSDSVKKRYGVTPKCFQDIRKALEDKEFDVVSIASCNHWHSLLTIWSCQADRDVYVEKPCSHNPFEGRKCVEAAIKHKRIVQHGTQSRSDKNWAKQIAAVKSGKYGKLLISYGFASKPRGSIGVKPAEEPPKALDFNIWVGPAPMQPFHRNLVHYNWHWFWDFGNGEIGNQGVHEIDVARWAIKGATLPGKVWSLGGRFAYDDQGQTPNTQMAVFEYGDVLLVFEVRGLVGKHKGFPFKVQNEYYTDEGVIRAGRFYPRKGGQGERLARFDVRVTPGGAWGSFVRVVRSRKALDLNAPVEHGHYSSALCHLANISYRLGEQVPFNAKAKTLGDNPRVVETFMNLQENLKGVGVKLEETRYRLGRVLTVDPKSEQFSGEGAKEANALLTRNYRKPFTVPDKI